MENASMKLIRHNLECSRILKPGGTIALSAWKNAFWGAIIKAALDTIPEDLPFPEGSGVLRLIHDEPWDSELFVRSQLEQGGFTDIHINVMSKQILMGVDEFLKVQDMMLPLVLSRCWTQELREKHEKRVPAVLRQYLEDKYGPDGSVVIEPVAIIATARKPL
ncbi:hypothetical protein ARAM_000242 [Aspergillus rambellii]|uniref:Methyltransferase type 11 domain-containing protein n=1 Tax=Aspergillus rambellii TaxID=308745 RepID=A0A0F8V3U8_9EURO|nr:hypothetical protein ARAM_000242 [Aspergillus rambellii]